VAVETLWRGSPIGVKLMMSSSAPPPRADGACVRIVASTNLDDAERIVVAKYGPVDVRFYNLFNALQALGGSPHYRGRVIAPCDADETRAAYFAKTPVG